MNLTNADSVFINGKEVQQISIDGNIVYSNGYRIRVTSDKSYILSGETVTISVNCEDLPHTEIELYKVINMTRTKIDTLTTDENGQASYVYTGTGAGEVDFIAEYDGKESNKITVDDYVPEATNIGLISSSSSVSYGTSITLTATVTDQHNQAISGQTVTFKEGNTNIGTGTTNSNGIATLSISLNAGAHTIKAVCGTANSSNITVNVNKLNTGLTIEVPALVYSDVFNVTGVLKDNNDNPIFGATVSLKWTVNNQEYTATADTNSSGEVTFAREAPTSITDYTFKLEFDGNTNYNASASSVIQRTVGKETSVLAITSPTSPASVSGSSFIMTGTLFDNDGEALEDAEITVEEYVASIPATVTIATAQVDENGDWSCEIPTNYMSDGDNTITVQYAGNIVYTSAVQSFTVRKVSFDGITLSSDKSILSYVDNDSATLTAQLTYNDVPVSVSGETVTFEVRKQSDDSLVETLTADTNSSGIATVSYLGKGVGDLNIKAECNLVSKSFVVQDCYYFDPQTTDKNRYTVVSGGASITYGSNGCTITGTANSVSLVKNTALTLPSEYEASFEITGLNGESSTSRQAYGGVVFDDWFTDWYNNFDCATYKLSTTSMLSRNLQNPSVNDVIKIVREGNTMKQYINDVLVSTDTNINHTGYFQHRTYKYGTNTGRSITVKNLKIKPL